MAPSSTTPEVTATPAPAVAAVEPPRGSWYGWQVVAASLAVSGLAVGGYRHFTTEKRIPIVISGMTLQIALAPWIHLAHGNRGAIARSLALQTALVAGGALVGAFAVQGLAGCPGPQSPCDRLDQTDFAAFGALLGAIVAPAVDAGWLAFDAPPVAHGQGLQLAPTFSLTPAGSGGAAGARASLGLLGIF